MKFDTMVFVLCVVHSSCDICHHVEEGYIQTPHVTTLSLFDILLESMLEKRNIDDHMFLKDLPNELMIEIFRNLSTLDTLRSYYNLNLRFQLRSSSIGEDHSKQVLQMMSNLCQLSASMNSSATDSTISILNGYRWENVLHYYLPYRQIFQMRIDFSFSNKDKYDKQAND